MKIGSLFSGIGGLELGLEWSGLGETVWQVEFDEGCRAVLAQHWPNATRFTDVRSVGATNLGPVDLICGGFPCQDVSSAGKRTGLSGTRSGLWFEYLRIVRELHPDWVVVENVASGASRWTDAVLTGLGEQGYACLPVPVSAAEVGAPHLRRRIFVVAHSNARGELAGAIAEMAVAPEPSANADSELVRQQSGWRGRSCRPGPTEPADNREAEALADAHEERCDGWSRALRRRLAKPKDSGWLRAQPDMVRVVSRTAGELDKRNASARIKALGNAVVPQCAEVVGWVIRELSA